jgi:predicted nucleic-acid-binding Zn-ribbon protein
MLTKIKKEKDKFQATGGDFAKIFDVQNKKFITIYEKVGI